MSEYTYVVWCTDQETEVAHLDTQEAAEKYVSDALDSCSDIERELAQSYVIEVR